MGFHQSSQPQIGDKEKVHRHEVSRHKGAEVVNYPQVLEECDGEGDELACILTGFLSCGGKSQ